MSILQHIKPKGKAEPQVKPIHLSPETERMLNNWRVIRQWERMKQQQMEDVRADVEVVEQV